jgi:hypothetical protein
MNNIDFVGRRPTSDPEHARRSVVETMEGRMIMKRFTTTLAALALLGSVGSAFAGTANGFFPIQEFQQPEYQQAIARAEQSRERASAYALTGEEKAAQARSESAREVSVPTNGSRSITVYDR